MAKIKAESDHRAEWAFHCWMQDYTMDEIAEALCVSKAMAWYYIERKRKEKQVWHRERPVLKYDENWRPEHGQTENVRDE